MIIDGKDAVMGRLASYAAKEALKGKEIIIVNCEKVIISGTKEDIEGKYRAGKEKIGSGQKGPKYSKNHEKVMKRAIRGMLPNHREGRGKYIFKKIKCYVGIPKEYESMDKVSVAVKKLNKFVELGKVRR